MGHPLAAEMQLDEDGVATVHLHGELDVHTAAVLDECLNQLSSEVRYVRLDAAELEFIDASGLRCLLAAERRVGSGRLIVEHPTRAVARVFAICELTRLLQEAPR